MPICRLIDAPVEVRASLWAMTSLITSLYYHSRGYHSRGHVISFYLGLRQDSHKEKSSIELF